VTGSDKYGSDHVTGQSAGLILSLLRRSLSAQTSSAFIK